MSEKAPHQRPPARRFPRSLALFAIFAITRGLTQHQQQLYEQINEFQRWPDPDAAQCESVSFELEGYDAAELQIPPGTAVGEGPIVVKFPDLLATIEDFAKVTSGGAAGRFTNTTVSFRRRHRAYHNLLALARASEVLGGRSGRGNSQQLRVRLRAPRETVSHPPLQLFPGAEVKDATGTTDSTSFGGQVSGARQAQELQLDLAELGLHPKRPGEEDGVGDDDRGGYRLMKARRLGRFENAFVKDPKLAELITDNSDLATGVFNLTSGEKHEHGAESKISNGVTIAASMTNQFVRYRWGAVNGGPDEGSDRVFPSEKAEQIFRQQFWELSETVLNSKREEILWAWEVLYDETVQSGERALYTDTTQVSVPHYSAAGQGLPALRPPGGERQPEEPSFYHRVVTRYPFYSALDRAEQATLDGIRKNLKHAEESYFPEPPVAHFGYRADRERHSFASFSDRLEAGKLREGLYKYTSMGALHPFFLVIEGLLQRFQKVLSQKCFPAVLLLAAVFYYDKFLETNGDIWCAIHEAQKKFVEIQQGMQRFDLLAQVIGLKLQDELEARVKAATGVQPLGATQTQTLHRRHLYDGVMRSCMLPVSSINAGGGQQAPAPPAGVSDAFEAIRRFTSDAFQSMHESQAAGNEMFALEMSHEHTSSFRMGNLTKAERMANYRDVLFEINDLFTNTLQLEWAPKGGTLMAFLRYAGNSHPSEEHFDLENDDIDLFIGAESETHSQHIMLEITERLKRSKFGVFHCFGKSVHPSANFTWRNDLLFCMRKEPVLMLLDIGSYLKVGNLAVAHRLCESESQFTDLPYNCEVHNELVFGGNNLTLDEIYPSEKCLAWNMTLPCPVPEKALKAVMIGGEKGTDAACPYLPTKDRLRKWGEADWTRLLDSMEEIERVGAEMEAKRLVPDVGLDAHRPRGNIVSIKPYVWDEPDCRSLVLQFSTPKIVDRVRACCENVQRGIREKRYEFFAGESSGRKYRKPYSFLKHGKSRSGSLEGAAGSEVHEEVGGELHEEDDDVEQVHEELHENYNVHDQEEGPPPGSDQESAEEHEFLNEELYHKSGCRCAARDRFPN